MQVTTSYVTLAHRKYRTNVVFRSSNNSLPGDYGI